MKATRTSALMLALAACLAASPPSLAQQAGGSVVVRNAVRHNLYLAGGEVDLRAEVDGDVAAAGGRVVVNGVVTRDALVAGGDVTVAGRVGDDVRAAGGMVTLAGPIAGELLAAGGRVRLAPESAVAGGAWLAGGNVEVRGQVGKGLRAAGGTIRLGGRIDGDVDLIGREIEIESDARIAGRLVYRSPRPARIDPGARIAGGVTHLEPQGPGRAAGVARIAAIVLGVVALVGLMTTGVVVVLLFPGFLTTSARTIATDPWKSLALGLALFLATPLVVLMLVVSVLGLLFLAALPPHASQLH